MTMGKTIRKKRVEKHLSQKDMADLLGVTSSAVSKWEKDKALPDVTLLGPLTRLLEVSLEELLDFQRELTEKQITDYVEEAHRKLKTEPFRGVLAWAEKIVLTYPRSYPLILWLATLLESQGVMADPGEKETQQNLLEKWYQRVLLHGEEKEKRSAAERLFYFYLQREEFEKAEGTLQYFSLENPERKRKKALLSARTGNPEEAWKAYEELLFTAFQGANETFQEMGALALEEKKLETAEFLAEKQRLLAKTFDMGLYYEAAPGLELAMLKKDPDATRKVVDEILKGIEELDSFNRSPLYTHMTFKELSRGFKDEIKANLLEDLNEREAFQQME